MRHLDPGAQPPAFGARPLRKRCHGDGQNRKIDGGRWMVTKVLRGWDGGCRNVEYSPKCFAAEWQNWGLHRLAEVALRSRLFDGNA